MAHPRKLPFLTIITSLIFFLQLTFSSSQSVIKGGYWNSDSGLAASDIEASHYSHLFCAFADLDPNTNSVTIASSKASQFSSFTEAVQTKNPSVKTLLSIGGGGGDTLSKRFSEMASSANTRKSFIDSSIKLARDNNFHGLDLDWEYPSSDTDKTNYGSLIKEWRSAIAAESTSSGKSALLLSAAVSGSDQISSLNHYPFQEIANNFDWINVMAYDLFIPDGYPDKTQPPAPLRNPGGLFSGDEGVSKWIQSGVPPEKLALGLPFYGYKWTLKDPNNGGLFADATNPGVGGVKYKDIVAVGGTVSYNSSYVTNYAQKGTDWYGYDDTQSISAKVAYAKQKGLLGYFAWNVEQDSNWILSRTDRFRTCNIHVERERPTVCSPLVVFGRMHRELAHGNGLRKMIVVGNGSTIYLNGDIVPRVKKLADDGERNFSSPEANGTMRVFTSVEIVGGTVAKIAETWVSVVEDRA